MTKIEADEADANEKSCKQAQAAEDDFLHHGAGDEEHLGADEPKNGDVVVRVVRWNSGQQERGTSYSEHDEGFAPAPGNRKLRASKFDGSHNKQRDISKRRINRLKLQTAEQQHHVQNGRGGRNVLLEVTFDRTLDVGKPEDKPVEE